MLQRTRCRLAVAALALGAGLLCPPAFAGGVDRAVYLQPTQPVTGPATGPGTAPATAPADATLEPVEVVIVRGIVEVSTDNEQTWRPAVVGMRLSQGATFRTGLRAS